MGDATILRLFISQAFAIMIILFLVPLKEPKKRNTVIVLICAFIITLINALLIEYVGISFYVRFYFLTLTLPYIILGLYFSKLNLSKFIFAVLTTQVIGNVAIMNGLLASYVFFGENTPYIDTIARVITYLAFLPIIIKFIRPMYIKMANLLNKGWWILNSALILSYALAYFILFVPTDIFQRPEYFVHAYIGLLLSLIIYSIIHYLFMEINTKIAIEQDKQILSTKVRSLSIQSAKMNKLAFSDALTDMKNRYSLFLDLEKAIVENEPFLVVFIDLDNLKEINDTYSHRHGDIYLTQFSQALQATIQECGEAYRFAGDEFVCIIDKDMENFQSENLEKEIESKINWDIQFTGFSYGIALFPKDGKDPDDLISYADQAMYVQKRQKHNKEI